MVFYFVIQSKSTNDLETKFDMDGTPEDNLSSYTSPLRLFLLFLITLSLWYSVGVGVSQIRTPVAIVCAVRMCEICVIQTSVLVLWNLRDGERRK